MPGDLLYWVLRRALDLAVWGGDLIGDVQLPLRGPAVFVANHAGAMGPIGIAASLPVRLHPWVIGDMLDPALAGPYLRKDFVTPELHVPDVLATPVSSGLSKVTVSLLRHLGSVPVWHDKELLETYRISGDLLAAARSLLIFPEDPEQPINKSTGLRPFKTGFAHLGRLHFDGTGQSLRFYPIAVHRKARRVQVAEPITYNSLNPDAVERRRVAHLLESIIAAMLAGGRERLAFGAHETR